MVVCLERNYLTIPEIRLGSSPEREKSRFRILFDLDGVLFQTHHWALVKAVNEAMAAQYSSFVPVTMEQVMEKMIRKEVVHIQEVAGLWPDKELVLKVIAQKRQDQEFHYQLSMREGAEEFMAGLRWRYPQATVIYATGRLPEVFEVSRRAIQEKGLLDGHFLGKPEGEDDATWKRDVGLRFGVNLTFEDNPRVIETLSEAGIPVIALVHEFNRFDRRLDLALCAVDNWSDPALSGMLESQYQHWVEDRETGLFVPLAVAA